MDEGKENACKASDEPVLVTDSENGVRNDADRGSDSPAGTFAGKVPADVPVPDAVKDAVTYPDGIDFTKMYQKGQTVFFIRISRFLGCKEFLELKLRTVEPRFMVGCRQKECAQAIGPDAAGQVFTDRKEALEYYDSVVIKTEENIITKGN